MMNILPCIIETVFEVTLETHVYCHHCDSQIQIILNSEQGQKSNLHKFFV